MQRTFNSDGIAIRYTDDGDGAAVLLVHGYTGAAHRWDQSGTKAALLERFRVLAVDCRGHGESDKPHDPDAYGRAMVEDLDRLLDHLQINQSAVVGYSMGAEIGLRMAVAHPDRVRLLVIGGSGWSGHKDTQNYQLLADSLQNSLQSSASFGPIARSMTPAGEPEPTVADIRSMDQMLDGQDLRALVAVARGMGDIINLTATEVAAIRIPVLGIAGEHDPERANLEKLADVMPNYTLQVLEGRDDMSAMVDRQFNRCIVAFLSAA